MQTASSAEKSNVSQVMIGFEFAPDWSKKWHVGSDWSAHVAWVLQSFVCNCEELLYMMHMCKQWNAKFSLSNNLWQNM